MFNLKFLAISLLLLLPLTALADWPQFRGANSQSNAGEMQLPVEWSVETGKNIAWTADLPGTGVSSPIVVDGKVIVTAASGPNRDRLQVLAFDQTTGKPVWQRQMWATGRTLCYRTSSVAAGSPASDGERVFALFSSNDVVALDLDGNLLWTRSLATEYPGLGNDIGMASSPVVVGDTVVVQCECQRVGIAIAFDKKTGATLWEAKRPADSNWASPVAVSTALGPAVLLTCEQDAKLYEAATGEELWKQPSENAGISSAVSLEGELILAAGGLTAIGLKPGATPEVLWSQGNLRPGPASVAVDANSLYLINRGGVLTAASRESGDIEWKKRLKGSFWASPLIAGGRLYAVNQEGTAFVVDLADKGKILAENPFGEDIYGSPVAADKALFVRSNGKLWKVATVEQAARPVDDRLPAL